MLQQSQIRSAYTDGSVNAARAGRKPPLTYLAFLGILMRFLSAGRKDRQDLVFLGTRFSAVGRKDWKGSYGCERADFGAIVL